MEGAEATCTVLGAKPLQFLLKLSRSFPFIFVKRLCHPSSELKVVWVLTESLRCIVDIGRIDFVQLSYIALLL